MGKVVIIPPIGIYISIQAVSEINTVFILSYAPPPIPYRKTWSFCIDIERHTASRDKLRSFVK